MSQITINFKTNNQIGEAQDYQNLLEQLFGDGLEISTLLLESLKITRHPLLGDAFIDDCKALAKSIGFIENLGYIEHTADWDLYLDITFINGTTSSTAGGYDQFEVTEDNNLKMLDSTDEGEEYDLIIPISDIQAISVSR